VTGVGSFGFEEMFLVAIVAIVVFGKDLPSIARKAGRWYRDIKRKVDDLKSEVRRQIPDVDLDSDIDSPPLPAPARDLSKPFDPTVRDLPAPPQVPGPGNPT